MINFEQLHSQNHKITELANVFLYLARDRAMCDTETACNVFFDYSEQVTQHLELVDKHIYPRLLHNADSSVHQKAERFMDGSQEIKRLFRAYLNAWSKSGRRELSICDHERFVKETQDMMDMMLERLQRETEHLYPLVRKVTGTEKIAA